MKFLTLATALSIFPISYAATDATLTHTQVVPVQGSDDAQIFSTVVPQQGQGAAPPGKPQNGSSNKTYSNGGANTSIPYGYSGNGHPGKGHPGKGHPGKGHPGKEHPGGYPYSGLNTTVPQGYPTTFVTKSNGDYPAYTPSPYSTSGPSNSSTGNSSNPVGGGADAKFFQPVLEAHNSKREEHGVKPLKWSEEVYKYAQAYADKYDCSGNLQHSLGKYGENLAVGYQDGVSAFNDWYAEGKNYDYSSASVLNHFTAIIWKGTTELGCAYKDCKSKGNGYYIVCSYNPAGNTVNEEKENLFPPK